MYEACNQALTLHPDFFDPIHKYAELSVESGDSEFVRVAYHDGRGWSCNLLFICA